MWKYYNPVEVVFGTGKLDELGQLMAERGLDRALIVSDPFTHRSGVAARLNECAGGRVLDIISEVEPNPTCDNVDACARRARELGARAIIGLGGGSAMDCAKAAAAAAAMDCTGLIPSAPVNEDALTSYETVYHYLPPQIKNAQKKTEDWKHP